MFKFLCTWYVESVCMRTLEAIVKHDHLMIQLISLELDNILNDLNKIWNIGWEKDWRCLVFPKCWKLRDRKWSSKNTHKGRNQWMNFLKRKSELTDPMWWINERWRGKQITEVGHKPPTIDVWCTFYLKT